MRGEGSEVKRGEEKRSWVKTSDDQEERRPTTLVVHFLSLVGARIQAAAAPCTDS